MKKNILNLVKLFKKYNGYIHEDLYIKFSQISGLGFFTRKKLKKKELLIKVPINLTINEGDFLNFLNFKKINYSHIDFLEAYIKSLPNIEFYQNNHPFFCNKMEQDLMIKIIEKNSLLKGILIYFFKKSESLKSFNFCFIKRTTGSDEKVICLYGLSKAINSPYLPAARTFTFGFSCTINTFAISFPFFF